MHEKTLTEIFNQKKPQYISVGKNPLLQGVEAICYKKSTMKFVESTLWNSVKNLIMEHLA
jgi:hypothetical protein